MSLHIVMVSSQVPPVYGGAGQQALLLGRTLTSRGHRVTLITLDQAGVGSNRVDGVNVLRVPFPALVNSSPRGLQSILLGIWAAGYVLMRGPDAVHIHGCYWWSVLPAVFARLRRAVLVVKVTRDGEDDPLTAHRKTVGRLPVGAVYGVPFRLADYVVALNLRSAASAESCGLTGKTRILTNGVDLSRFPPRTRWPYDLRAENKLRISFLGYLVRHKGVLELIEAFCCMGDRRLELYLIGPLRGNYRELEESVADQIELAAAADDRISILGHVDPSEALQHLIKTDIFCLPSHVEGMPNSLLEAEAAGCLVVASRIPGIEELDDGSFILHKAGDSESLRFALESAVALICTGAREPMNPAGHGIEALATEYENMYTKRSQ